MNKLKLFLKSIIYSGRLIYRSSGLLILIYFILNLVNSTISFLNTYIFKYIIDTLSDRNEQITSIIILIILYAVSLFMSQFSGSIQSILHNMIFKKAEHLYECELSEKLSKLSLSVIDSSEGKNIIEDVRFTKNTAIYAVFRIIKIISLLYTFIIAYISIFKFNYLFACAFLLLTIPGIILNQVFDKKSEQMRHKTAPDVRKFSYYRWMLTDAWPAKDVRMYNLTEPIKERYGDEKKRYLFANKHLDRKKLFSLTIAELIRRSGEVIFTIFVVLSAIKGEISIGDIALYTGFALKSSNAFYNIVYTLVMAFTRTTEAMNRLFDFLKLESDNINQQYRKLSVFESLSFDNVYFMYPYTNKYVLSGVSFTLKKGEKLSIVGINGSGKSTIVKLVLGLYKINSGQIKINGYPISDYSIFDVRKLFSVLFQNYVQYPLSLRENVALSSIGKIHNDEEIKRALHSSGIYCELSPRLENGLDSFMSKSFDDKGIELSKGQWQKIALSRVYFKNAPVTIFDEPSAALDAEAEDKIFKNFGSLSSNKTAIMISHRISSARISDKIIVLDGGKIIEEGTHNELISRKGLYEKLYSLQKSKYCIREEKN